MQTRISAKIMAATAPACAMRIERRCGSGASPGLLGEFAQGCAGSEIRCAVIPRHTPDRGCGGEIRARRHYPYVAHPPDEVSARPRSTRREWRENVDGDPSGNAGGLRRRKALCARALKIEREHASHLDRCGIRDGRAALRRRTDCGLPARASAPFLRESSRHSALPRASGAERRRADGRQCARLISPESSARFRHGKSSPRATSTASPPNSGRRAPPFSIMSCSRE